MKRFLGGWMTASDEDSKQAITAATFADDEHEPGLIAATTGVALRKTPATTNRSVLPTCHDPPMKEERRHPSSTCTSHTNKGTHWFDEDDLLADTFDRNDNDEEAGSNGRESPLFVTVPDAKQLASFDTIQAHSLEMAQTQVTTLETAIEKLQHRVSCWEQQAIACGRAALNEARTNGNKTLQLTSKVKLHLLRRKLLLINLTNAQSQLEQLGASKALFEKLIHDKVAQQQAEWEQLESVVEQTDVLQEVLSNDLQHDLMDDDVTSSVDYNEAELLEELRVLSAEPISCSGKDDSDTPSSNGPMLVATLF